MWSSHAKPRVFIRTCGGSQFGVGHVVRSVELARRLEARGVSVTVSVNADPIVQALVSGTHVPVLVADTIDEMTEQVLVSEAELVVLDQPFSPTPYIAGIRRRLRAFVALLDPPKEDGYRADLIVTLFNHSGSAWRTQSGCLYREGLEYSILRSQFAQREVGSNGTAREVLISFGGVDPNRLTLKVLLALRGLDLPGWRFHVIIGSGYDSDFVHAIHAAIGEQPHPVRCSTAVVDMAAVMRTSTWGVIGSGSTLMEMACLGRATLTLAQTTDECRFAQYFGNRGATEFLGLGEDVSDARIASAIERLCRDAEAMRTMGAQAGQLIDGLGGERVVDLLLQAYDEKVAVWATPSSS